MSPSELEDFYSSWRIQDPKVFKLRVWVDQYEYITMTKDSENLVRTDPERSTTTLKLLDKNDFLRMLGSDEISYVKDWTWHTDTKEMKTGGCTCGAWVLKDNEYLHRKESPGIAACKIYKRY
jgi:hypothetical protein